jgi:hypothetical protein
MTDPDQWVMVHLTWSREQNPRWPASKVLATWDQVTAALIDHGHE